VGIVFSLIVVVATVCFDCYAPSWAPEINDVTEDHRLPFESDP